MFLPLIAFAATSFANIPTTSASGNGNVANASNVLYIALVSPSSAKSHSVGLINHVHCFRHLDFHLQLMHGYFSVYQVHYSILQ